MITSKKCWIYFLSSFVKLVWSSVLTGVSAELHTLIHQVRVHWERLNDSWGCDWTNCLSVTFKTTNQDILLFHPVATAFDSSWEDFFLEKTTLVLFIFLLLKKCCPALIKQPILQRPCWVCSKAHSAFSSIQSMQIDFSIKLSSIKLYDRQEVSSSINGNVCLQKCCKKKKKKEQEFVTVDSHHASFGWVTTSPPYQAPSPVILGEPQQGRALWDVGWAGFPSEDVHHAEATSGQHKRDGD